MSDLICRCPNNCNCRHKINETNSERLEHLKEQWKINLMTSGDFAWLIQQAERAQELEKEMKDIIETADVIDYRNQVMREALKFYADYDKYQCAEWESPPIVDDSGDKALQALGESHDRT